MSILTQTVSTDAELSGIPIDRLQRFTQQQFEIASEAGVFAKRDRVELVDGLIHQGGASGPLYRLSLDQFHRLDVISEFKRNELLGGWLVTRTPINPPHRIATYNTRVNLERLVPKGKYYVDQGAPSSMPRSDSEPLPDVQVIRGTVDDYPDRHPTPADLAIVVEISDSTISLDRNYKLRLYAREGISIYWIVNLASMWLEVYSDPSGPSENPTYRVHEQFGPHDEVPLVLDGIEVGKIAVRDLLP
jgi:hypothetical protein